MAWSKGGASQGGFYAVRVGRTPGVYTTWKECQEMVNGYPAAKFKKFPTHEDAMAFVSGTDPTSRNARSNPSGPGSSSAASKSGTKRTASDAALDSADQNGSSRAAPPSIFPFAGSSAKKINVYTDGASSGNGRDDAKAGWGVWFEDEALRHLNEGKRLPGKLQTNNRAELTAVWRACVLCPEPDAQLVIFTDSIYCVKAINTWQQGWRKKGWKLASGGRVQNVDLIRRIERAFRARTLRPALVHVAGHAGIHGNEEADRLAVHGATLPEASESEVLGELSDSEDERKPAPSKKARR